MVSSAACTTTKSATQPTPAATTSSPSTPQATHTVPHPAGPATEGVRGPRNRKQVALTFHGQEDLAVATAVLDVLAAHQAIATVMAVGRWLATNPSMAEAISTGGHELGNHT